MKDIRVRSLENINEAIEQYSDMILKVALSITKDRATAEDILQDVFIKYMTDPTDFQENEHKKAWLLRVTINECNKFFRSLWNVRKIPLEDDYPFLDPEKHEVFYAVMDLPTKYRLIIHLFYYEEMSVNEIGKLLSIKESTIRSRLFRGRKMLKDVLEVEYDYGSI